MYKDYRNKSGNPGMLLHNLRDSFLAWIRTSGQQLTLNGKSFSNVKTVKITIGAPGKDGCDFNWATAANTTAQNLDLGAIIPALARVLDVKAVTEEVHTGAVSLAVTIGNASAGTQFVASATLYALNAIVAMGHTLGFNVAPNIAATKIWVGGTPGANWSLMTAGKISVYVTYIETN